jgi:DHA2 family methylenomycin A resistance protein-like MFS transporter
MTTTVLPIARERPYGLYAICFGFFLVLLDTTALNVAAASMEREFGSGLSGLQWVLNAYTIVFASLLLTGGAMGDRFGAKRLYEIGLALFTGASLCCSLAPTVAALVGLRMVQGVGAAVMLPASLGLLSHAFPDAGERARAVSFWASIVSLGFAAGPALGGALTFAFGWRSIFLLNVPVGLFALALVRRYVEETRVNHARRIDWTGQAAAVLVLSALTYALIEAGRLGWVAPRILAGFIVAAAGAILFSLFERRSASPVLPPHLFANPAFSVCVVASLGIGFGMYGTLFVESVRLQNVHHLSALAAGLMIVPFTVTPALTTRAIDRFDGRMHFRPRLAIGHVIAAAGAIVMMVSVWTSFGGFSFVEIGLGLLGVSLGYITPAMTAGVLASSPPETSSAASGILNAARQVGALVGVALMGALMQTSGDRGLLASFAIVLVISVGMTVLALRLIPAPNAGP